MTLAVLRPEISIDALVPFAMAAVDRSYVAYSNVPMGALLRTASGKVFVGSSIETANYDGLYAPESAIGTMISTDGWQEGDGSPKRIAEVIIAGRNIDDIFPDGRVLSRLRTLGSEDTVIHLATDGEIKEVHLLKQLLTRAPAPKSAEGFASTLKRHETGIGLPPEDQRLKWTRAARATAYAPYSGYRVGAMLRTTTGEIYTGCNIEFGRNDGLHGEMVAIGNMINSLGVQGRLGRTGIEEILVMGGEVGDGVICTPCGKCRQFIREFTGEKAAILAAGPEDIRLRIMQGELLPHSFGPDNILSAKRALIQAERGGAPCPA